MRTLSPHLSAAYRRWECLENECADSQDGTIDIIRKLTLELAERSYRGVIIDREDLIDLEDLDE
jgi:hypothetical protein